MLQRTVGPHLCRHPQGSLVEGRVVHQADLRQTLDWFRSGFCLLVGSQFWSYPLALPPISPRTVCAWASHRPVDHLSSLVEVAGVFWVLVVGALRVQRPEDRPNSL